MLKEILKRMTQGSASERRVVRKRKYIKTKNRKRIQKASRRRNRR